MELILKTCSKCKCSKPILEYNKDKRYSDGYFAWCKTCMREYRIAWEKANSKRRHEYQAEWHRNRRFDPDYREYNNLQILTSRKKDPLYRDKKKQWEAKRRCKIAGSSQNFTHLEWEELCEKYNHRCLACGEKKKLTPDHIIPLARDGNNSINNIQPLCINCNSSKKTKTIDYRWEMT